MIYTFTQDEISRFTVALRSAIAMPFIDDIEDFVVEVIFAYMKNITIQDPFLHIRSKRLYDVVDTRTQTGWSVKSIQYSYAPCSRIELVIQRADIFKKAHILGFEYLSKDTDTQILGRALLKHWQDKVDEDAIIQRVTSKRVFILLKQKNSTGQYSLFEEDLHHYTPEDLVWQWTDDSKTGLQGVRLSDGQVIYRWYPNQKQLFEGFFLPLELTDIRVTPIRLEIAQVVDIVSEYLANNQ